MINAIVVQVSTKKSIKLLSFLIVQLSHGTRSRASHHHQI